MSGATRLLDVANAAGVSLRTASRVLNDDPRVAPLTRHRVQAAMLDLRFEPDAMARSLRAGTDTAIGFVVESIADPFFAEVIDAAELEMSRHGRSVLVASTRRDPDWERDVIGRMVQRRVAGLLLSPTGGDHAWLDPRVPGVLVDRPAPGLSADLVEIDDYRAAFGAVAHLFARGHRRIAYVGDTQAIPTSAARLRGYRDGPAVTVVDHPGHEVGRVAAARLLARLDDPGLPVERIQVQARLIERGSGELRP